MNAQKLLAALWNVLNNDHLCYCIICKGSEEEQIELEVSKASNPGKM